jgi:hypothetical protein
MWRLPASVEVFYIVWSMLEFGNSLPNIFKRNYFEYIWECMPKSQPWDHTGPWLNPVVTAKDHIRVTRKTCSFMLNRTSHSNSFARNLYFQIDEYYTSRNVLIQIAQNANNYNFKSKHRLNNSSFNQFCCAIYS